MPLPITSEDPIVIIVGEESWDAYTLHRKEPNQRDVMLFELLEGMGGIAETVEPGIYHFNAMWLDADHVVASLEMVPK